MLPRADLEEVSAGRADAAAEDGFTDIEAMRVIGRGLTLAAQKLGIPLDIGLDELCQRILAGAHRGGIDPLTYRVVWMVAHAPSGKASA
jgi:hypothetical protein